MRQALHVWLCLVCGLTSVANVSGAGARARARLQPAPAADEEPAEDEERVVLVSNDLYSNYRARPEPRLDLDSAYRTPQPRARVAEAPRQPPVQTIRNYNKVNDDGSFTFGYEAADGSFKEETRGTDCVVRGKYGYIDPDGNKREFTYVSGNPCDPNRPDEDENEPDSPDSAETDDAGPANYPTRPRRPLPAAPPARAPTAYFETDFGEEEEAPVRVAQRPRPPPAQLAITPRPQPVSTAPPPTTFRPQLVATPTPAAPLLPFRYSQPTSPAPQPRPRPSPGPIDFAAEFAKFQRENQPQTAAAGSPRPAPLYSTELVLDPASGQYDTRLFQTLPQSGGDLNLDGRLPQYVPQPRPFPASAPLRRPAESFVPADQAAYQRQQAEAQYANSAQLFQQQQQLQQSQLQRDRAAARAQAQRLSARPHPLYYQQSAPLDSFLRPQF